MGKGSADCGGYSGRNPISVHHGISVQTVKNFFGILTNFLSKKLRSFSIKCFFCVLIL
jgi:hypothetical protein